MKQFYLSLFTLLAGLTLQAQTLVQTNHAPTVGDVHNTYQCDSTGISPGASGAGVTWNYASIITHSNIARTYTNNLYAGAEFAPADLAKFSGANDISYYRPSATELNYYGGAIKISTTTANLDYSSPAIQGVYPMNLNSAGSSSVAGTMTVMSIAASFTGSSSVVYDATGTLTLPGGAAGTFTNIARVVNSQTLNFSVPFVGTGTITLRTYDYYAVGGSKVPLLSINTSSLVNSLVGTIVGTVVTINKDYPSIATSTVNVGIRNNKITEAQISVFPNPSSTFVNLNTDNLAVTEALIYDITGKLVDQQNFVEGKIKLDVSAYNNGIYIYKATNASGQTMKTGKLTVTH